MVPMDQGICNWDAKYAETFRNIFGLILGRAGGKGINASSCTTSNMFAITL